MHTAIRYSGNASMSRPPTAACWLRSASLIAGYLARHGSGRCRRSAWASRTAGSSLATGTRTTSRNTAPTAPCPRLSYAGARATSPRSRSRCSTRTRRCSLGTSSPSASRMHGVLSGSHGASNFGGDRRRAEAGAGRLRGHPKRRARGQPQRRLRLGRRVRVRRRVEVRRRLRRLRPVTAPRSRAPSCFSPAQVVVQPSHEHAVVAVADGRDGEMGPPRRPTNFGPARARSQRRQRRPQNGRRREDRRIGGPDTVGTLRRCGEPPGALGIVASIVGRPKRGERRRSTEEAGS